MKIDNKEFLNPQQQLYQNTKDIEELKEKYKNEVYAVKPFSEWPEDVVPPVVEDPRDFTYVPRAITNVPADAKYGYLLINVETEDGGALLFKIKSVNNSTVYIEFYANVSSQVPGPQGEQGIQGIQGIQGPQGNSIFSCDANLDPTPDELTAVSTALIHKGSSTLKVGDIIVGVDGIFGYLSSVGQITSYVTTVGSLKGPQGTATIGIQVVATLPSSGTEGVIYLVPAEDPETGNAYDEYIYTNSSWEKFGYINVDLTNYALKSEIPVVNEGFTPKTTYTYDLGSSTKLYKNLYVGGIKNTYFNILTGGVNDHGTAIFSSTDAQGNTEATLRLDYNKIQANQNLVPSANNTLDLGTSGLKYKDLYLAGSLKDGTNSVAIADIVTTTDLPNYNITNVVTDNADVLGMQVYNTSAGVSYNFYNVNPNPTLAGTESDLASIDIGGTAYKIPTFSGNYNDLTNKPSLATVATTGSYNDLTNKPTLGTAASADTGTSSGDVPVLDANGKLSTSVLPAITVTDTFVVASEAAMLALTAEVGDVAVRTDLNKSFILQTDGASTLSHWQELLTPTDSVTSVNGQTGAVTLTIPDAVVANQNIGTTDGGDLFKLVVGNTYYTVPTPASPQIAYFIQGSSYTPYNTYINTLNNTIIDVEEVPQYASNANYTLLSGYFGEDFIAYIPELGFLNARYEQAGVWNYNIITPPVPNIVYSATQPSNPVNGTIWIKPTN